MARILPCSQKLLAVAVGVLALGCTRNIPQDMATGQDGKRKGAREIRLEDGEGRARDTVTYPGGDRVDWKKFVIPEGQGGSLRIKMKVRPPRPGHTVAFILYDQYYRRLEQTTKRPRRVKSVTLDHAPPGTYYLQIYAPRRKDAGDYRISLRYREGENASDPCDRDPSAAGCADIPPPPKLPAIPETECRRDKDCEEGYQCVENSCRKRNPCDSKQCPAGQSCRVEGSDAVCVAEEPEVKCVRARLVRYQLSSSGSVIVTVNRGKSASVEQGWTGRVLVKTTSRPLNGGEFKVTKVTQGESVGKVRLSLDQLSANRQIELCPK